VGLKELTLGNLKDLDFGKASTTFEVALQRAVKDCLDRPGDDRARTVVLEMKITPVKEILGNTLSCEGAKGVFRIKCTLPNWETQVVDFGVRSNGKLVFNEDSPRDHRQQTFLGEEEENAEG